METVGWMLMDESGKMRVLAPGFFVRNRMRASFIIMQSVAYVKYDRNGPPRDPLVCPGERLQFEQTEPAARNERNERMPSMEPLIVREASRFNLPRTAFVFILLVSPLMIGGIGPDAPAAASSALSLTSIDIDADASHIGIEVRLSMGSFKGVLEKFDARIQFDGGAKSVRAAELDFDFADLKTGNKQRDKDMLKWMDYENHPVASFRLEELAPRGEQLEARGTLTMHGVSRPIAFPVSIVAEGERATIDGEAKLNFLEFDLKPIRKMLFLTVQPEMDVVFHIEGRY